MKLRNIQTDPGKGKRKARGELMRPLASGRGKAKRPSGWRDAAVMALLDRKKLGSRKGKRGRTSE